MRKTIWIIGALATAIATISPAAAQDWRNPGWGGGWRGGWEQNRGYGLTNNLCSGERAHRIEARIGREFNEGDIDGNTARWLHRQVDRLERDQRDVCRYGNTRDLADLARRYERVEQRLHFEADGSRRL